MSSTITHNAYNQEQHWTTHEHYRLFSQLRTRSSCDTCDATMKSGFSSRERCATPQFVVFFVVTRTSLSEFRISKDFLNSTTYVSEGLFESGENNG